MIHLPDTPDTTTLVVNRDVNARRADYTHAANEALVTKIFYTIQGEGPLAGEPAIFVRLAGCNLGSKESCPFCDTEFSLKAGTVMRAAKILEQADALWTARSGPGLMVLTGGEPMLQNPYLLVDYFLNHGWRVQIETNGYFWSNEMRDVVLRQCPFISIVVSPKVNTRQVYPEIHPWLWTDSDCLKILVDDDPQSPYHKPPDYAESYFRSGKPVYVSPINIYRATPNPDVPPSLWDFGDSAVLDHERCRRNCRYAVKLAKAKGWRISLQTHLLLDVE